MTADVLHMGRWQPEPDIAIKLRAVRRGYAKQVNRKVSQREFAAIIDVGEKAYAAYESGENKPPDVVALALKLRDSVGLDPAYLVDLAPDPDDPDTQVTPRKAWCADVVELARFSPSRAA